MGGSGKLRVPQDLWPQRTHRSPTERGSWPLSIPGMLSPFEAPWAEMRWRLILTSTARDRLAALRGSLAVVAGLAFLGTLISTLTGSSSPLVFGVSSAGCLLMGTIAWQSLRTFLHRSTMSAQSLHIRSALREALVHNEDIAGVGLIGIPWRKGSTLCRWVPVVWTSTTIQSIPNVVAYRKRDFDAAGLLSLRPGEVASDILNRVLTAQGPVGLIHQNLLPPVHNTYRVVRLLPNGAVDNQAASRLRSDCPHTPGWGGR